MGGGQSYYMQRTLTRIRDGMAKKSGNTTKTDGTKSSWSNAENGKIKKSND